MKRVLLLLCGSWALFMVGCKQGGGAGGRSRGYDVKPLLEALRPATRKDLPKRLGLSSLAELPFYDLELQVSPTSLKGRCELHYRNRTGRPLPVLPLLLHPNAPRELGVADSGSLDVFAAKALQGPKVKLVRRRPTLVELRFERPLKQGETGLLEVKFSGRPRQLPAGSNDIFNQALASLGMAQGGASDYGLLAYGDGILTIASAYPMIAPPREDGSFDTSAPTRFGDLAYNGIANYRVRTTTPAGYTLASNLKDGAATKGKDGDVFTSVGAANRDLVIVAGPSLAKLEAKVGAITVRSFFLSKDRAGGKRALAEATRSLEFFQQRYGAYPYIDLDVAEATIVGGAGGVEFPGMVLIAGMLYRSPSRGTGPLATLMRTFSGLGDMLQRLQGGAKGQGGKGLDGGLKKMDEVVTNMAAFTVAHEVAHQYFAGLIGADSRRDPAVDEPLAQFAAADALASRGGDGSAALEMNAKMSYAVYRMMGGADMAAAQPVNKFPSSLAYAAIVYGKAPYFYLALRDKIGVERFDKMLRAAVDDQRFKIVSLKQWIATLARHAGDGAGVQQLAKRWFYETHGDEDLKVDTSGDALFEQLLGKAAAAELKRSLGMLGTKPGDLFRTLLGDPSGSKKEKAPSGLLDMLLGK